MPFLSSHKKITHFNEQNKNKQTQTLEHHFLSVVSVNFLRIINFKSIKPQIAIEYCTKKTLSYSLLFCYGPLTVYKARQKINVRLYFGKISICDQLVDREQRLFLTLTFPPFDSRQSVGKQRENKIQNPARDIFCFS